METHQKVTYGILGILSLILAGFGGSMLLTQDQLDHAYVCSFNENVGFFDKLSSTMKTGYWTDEQNVSRSSICKNGTWISLKDYAKSKGVSIDSILQKENSIPEATPNVAKKYRCDTEKCVAI
jgi:hypothetical protein